VIPVNNGHTVHVNLWSDCLRCDRPAYSCATASSGDRIAVIGLIEVFHDDIFAGPGLEPLLKLLNGPNPNDIQNRWFAPPFARAPALGSTSSVDTGPRFRTEAFQDTIDATVRRGAIGITSGAITKVDVMSPIRGLIRIDVKRFWQRGSVRFGGAEPASLWFGSLQEEQR
jgi:hypothetical protein